MTNDPSFLETKGLIIIIVIGLALLAAIFFACTRARGKTATTDPQQAARKTSPPHILALYQRLMQSRAGNLGYPTSDPATATAIAITTMPKNNSNSRGDLHTVTVDSSRHVGVFDASR
ncbi:hypothetical protein BDZ88DRAFT_487718 [Geranomyces variabilis]|nr:hypothetical protein BDZ88DRAFT_487718 [Geranomyces variabilis]